MTTHKLTLKGTVQGVGFRPFIYTLAKRYNLKGTVSNGSNGVEIVINADNIEPFVTSIKEELPSLAEIETIQIEEVAFQNFQDFQIIETSSQGDVTVNIPPDISICSECEKELFDPTNRRYGYPFITCTHCGVRYSIINDLPYDRVNTSMKFFKMCDACEEEYNNPLDRRYHAQPIGCWDCGVSLSLWDRSEELIVNSEKLIDKVVNLLEEGNILAIKGVGGYHLVCDATNSEAIQKLRDRKHRPTKPFAVMVRDMEMARELSEINAKEEELLTSKERPIVLLNQKTIHSSLLTLHSKKVAPNISRIGLFLPYTPLHLLILKKLNRPLVATSANVTDEPIATNKESIEKLSSVYDYLLDHDREIVNGCDDSVVMVVNDQTVFLRRARGYTPVAIKLPFNLSKKVLAVGANQKSTIAIGFDDQVILSPHIGDLDGIASVEYFRENIENLKRIYRFEPEVVVHDKHPNYESTKYAKELFTIHFSLFTKKVQHHYAHILGVMAEKSITTKVLGVAFDGTGYGDDGNLWGGEFMLCDYQGYERVAHINSFKLLGGAKAIKEPKRVALSLLFDAYGDEVLSLENATTKAFTPNELKTQYLMWQKGLNAPLSSSVGRLFDAVASLTGVCQVMSFEGESGMRMEELYDEAITSCYDFSFEDGLIDILPMIKAINEEDTVVAISKFFNTLVEMIEHIYKLYNLPLVLSGGVFQNRVLLGLVLERIPTAILPTKIPPNDGGIALGQVVSLGNHL